MLSVYLALDPYQKKDGTHAISYMIYGNGRAKMKIPNISIPKDYWDSTTKSVTKMYKGRSKTELNSILQRRLNDMQDHLLNVGNVTAKEAVNRFVNRVDGVRITDLFQEEITNLKKHKREGSARAREGTLSKLKEFSPYLNVSEIDVKILENFDSWMRDNGLKPNSRGVHLRQLRAVLNNAQSKGIDTLEPFKRFSTPKARTPKRNITVDQLRLIKQLELPDKLNEYRRLFFECFKMAGISYVDLHYLTPDNIQGNYIVYSRRKISETKYKPIIKTWISKETKEYLKSKGKPVSYKDYRTRLRAVNGAFKEIGDKIGVKLSTHVIRHSWATIAKRQGYSKELISEILGHSAPGSQMTEIYTDEFHQETKDEVVRTISLLL